MLDETQQPENESKDVVEPESTVENDIPETSPDDLPQVENTGDESNEQSPETLEESLSTANVMSESDLDGSENDAPAMSPEFFNADTEPDRPKELASSIEDVLEANDAESTIEVISEVDLDTEDETELVVTTFELDADDDEDDEIDSSELNIAIEAATEPVTVLSEADLELLDKVTSKKEPDDNEEIVIKDYLNEDDGEDFAPDYLKPLEPDVTSEKETDDNEEVVVKDYLNEDDGDSFTPDYLKPPEPEWKLVARQLREEREAEQRAMIEKRREEDERVIAERKSRREEREEEKRQQEETFSQVWEKRQNEKQQAYDEMIERIRKEREEKLQERAETEEREFGRKLSYPKPEPRTPYPKPSELKRMEREQPKNVVDSQDSQQPSPPRNKPAGDDFESRVSRLSKPDEPSDTKPDEPEDKPDSEE